MPFLEISKNDFHITIIAGRKFELTSLMLSKWLYLTVRVGMMKRFNQPEYVAYLIAGNIQFIAFLQIHPESSTHA